MLPHGSPELALLADQCSVTSHNATNGWDIDVWDMTTRDVDLTVDVYNAVLAAGAAPKDPIYAQLAKKGIDVATLLAAPQQGRDLITRADIAEYAAAASVMAVDGFTGQTMHMPNIPKMARRKSDSGIDVFDIKLDASLPEGSTSLSDADKIGLASVKHMTAAKASPLRLNIARSISPHHELTHPYLVAQLRFIHGRMVAEGKSAASARRIFLFMDDFPDPSRVGLYGIAVIDPKFRDAMMDQLEHLPNVSGGHKFRVITFPDLENVQSRCP